MTTLMIVLALAVLAVGIVWWAVRRTPARPYEQRLEQDTAWNDPVTPADAKPDAAPADPFAAAPPGREPQP
ncbi:MAG: hypothetical protein KF910_06435 [Brevundimonas sp.]|uniref:hypothetical protein n=1 Tax=Brevundimonas sp. TaxID=1871086 RepID=UPI0025C4D39A|nr:hypothetical protein [Brevundimonas sp.]MBX3477224.1 hypothetical protein [Brevundimonas sp.]